MKWCHITFIALWRCPCLGDRWSCLFFLFVDELLFDDGHAGWRSIEVGDAASSSTACIFAEEGVLKKSANLFRILEFEVRFSKREVYVIFVSHVMSSLTSACTRVQGAERYV